MTLFALETPPISPMIPLVIEESEMNAADGVLVIGAEGSPGRHIASALMRLGQRTMLQMPRSEKLDSLKPLNAEVIRSEGLFPTVSELLAAKRAFTSLVVAPSRSLSTGTAMSAADAAAWIAFLSEIETKLPEVNKIILVSEFESAETFEKALAACPSARWILCPLVVGFRDNNLFDELFFPLRHSKPLMIASPREYGDLEIAFANDVAGAVVSALRKPETPEKIVRLPANVRGISRLAETFRDSMREYEAGVFDRLFRRPKLIGQQIKLLDSQKVNQSSQFNSYPLASDVFPNPPTRPDRFWAQAKELWIREPLMDLHFPPSRAL